MVKAGYFFFKYRNWIFPLLYAVLFIPSWPIFSKEQLGENYFYWSIAAGLFITLFGQLIRGVTIGLVYIIRGGKEGRPYAENLITEGIFSICRNPLYLGNIFILLGLGVIDNSLLYVTLFVPLFILIYLSIISAEEDFLNKKYGAEYADYSGKVNRWWPDLKKVNLVFAGKTFSWKRWIVKEHTSLFIWLCGITAILFFRYPEITNDNKQVRNICFGIIIGTLIVVYLTIRFFKKRGQFKAE